MLRRLALLLIFSIVILQSAFVGSEQSSAPPPEKWHLDGWKHRVTYTVVDQFEAARNELARGGLYARVELHTGDRERLDGADIRVVNDDGDFVRTWVGKRESHGVRVIYCRPGKEARLHVYFGNPDAEMPLTDVFKGVPLNSSLHGLELTIYTSPLTPLETAINVEKNISTLKKLLTTFVSNVDISGGSPLLKSLESFQQLPLLFVFRGFVEAPWDGEYFFGTDSQGGSFLLIDGIEVAAWPGEHWKHGSYINGGRIRLRRGTHTFMYVNQRLPRQPLLMSAGWECPGYPDSYLIPEDSFVKYAVLTTVASYDAPGVETLDCDIIERFNMTLNGGERMAHFEMRAFGSHARKAKWTLSRADRSYKGDPELPFTVNGSKVDLFLNAEGKWKVTLSNKAVKPMEMILGYSKTDIVYPFYLDCELDGVPPAVFRGLPFGVLLNVPNETKLTPVVDFTVEQVTGDTVVRSGSNRKKIIEGYHVLSDVIFDPRRKEFFSLPGIPFTPGGFGEVDNSLYRSVFRFTTKVNAHKISEYEIAFLGFTDPLPEGLTTDELGHLVIGKRRIILLSEVEDASVFRRWAPIKGISRLSLSLKKFLVIGDSYAIRDEGLPLEIASAIREKGGTADHVPCSERPFPFYGAIAGALPKLESNSYDCLVIAAGFSDCLLRTPPATLETLIHAIADRAREKGVKSIVLLLPPLVPGFERIIRKYRGNLTDLAARLRLDIYDLDDPLSGAFHADGDFFTRYPARDSLKSAAKGIASKLVD